MTNKIFLFFLLLVCCSSCFEIQEEIQIAKNGSGTYALLIDVSESRSMFDAIDKIQKSNTSNKHIVSPLSGIDSTLLVIIDDIKMLPGVQNSKIVSDREHLVFGIKFTFQNVEALNSAIAQMDLNDNGYFNNMYSYSKRTFTKSKDSVLPRIMAEMGTDPDTQRNKIASFYSQIQYKCTIRTSGIIKKFSNPRAEITATNDAVVFTASLEELFSGTINLKNIIKIK